MKQQSNTHVHLYKQDGRNSLSRLSGSSLPAVEVVPAQITVSEYLPGQENGVADQESWSIKTSAEWKLHHSRPPQLRYAGTWEVSKVVDYIASMGENSEVLSRKLCLLMGLVATG